MPRCTLKGLLCLGGGGKGTWTLYLRRVAFAIYLVLVAYALLNYRSRVHYYKSQEDFLADSSFRIKSDTSRCELDIRSLAGLQKIDTFARPSFEEIRALNPFVEPGGRWSPSNCSSWQRVAVIIPYRDRLDHLKLLLHRLHPMLQRQLLDYQIFVIEQLGTGPFNRGAIRNVGALAALKHSSMFDCLIFHDVDMIPEHDLNLYHCNQHLHHLSSALDEMRYHVMYGNSAGGVVAITKENLEKVNGYSNSYWGWGNEDDDFSARTEAAELLLTRPAEHIGRYKMARHVKQWRSNDGNNLFLSWRSRWKTDGLNSIDLSKLQPTTTLLPLYTLVTVDLGLPPRQDDVAQSSAPKESWLWFILFYIP